MSTSKITNYFEKIPTSRSGMVKKTVTDITSHATTSSNAGQFNKISGTDHMDGTSLLEADVSMKPRNLEKQHIVIDLEAQEDSSDEEVCI
jgi:hypothetical protein